MLVKEFSIESKLESVLYLQKIDSKIDKINTLKGELPLIVNDLEDDLAGLHTRIENVEKESDAIERFIIDKRNAKKTTQDLIEKYEKQSEAVKNKREFDAITKEIESSELEIKHIDKQIREANGRLKEYKTSLEKIQDKIDDVTETLTEKTKDLDVILKETAKEETILMQESNNYKEKVDERILKAYENLRKSFKNGLALVPVERESCGGCFNQIPPQRQAEIALHKKIVICEHCGRILVDDELFNKVEVK